MREVGSRRGQRAEVTGASLRMRSTVIASCGAPRVPALIVHSEEALTPNLAHAFYTTVNSPKQDWLESQGQIDFYDDPKLVTPAADAVAAVPR
jgi:hypothetical protein